ncbi:IclR family transcriptional regulator, partial [Stenotrophomonas sp. MB339]|uniref:IclR family transcriptional regulator domain-containing protein n=1 Tax=Stenotrophomonas sp. MB339 TaxID=1663558 RepID=UPI0009D1287F
LPGNGPSQLYDREALWQMVQQDKARGYVIGESFYRHGISSIVYPVFNRSGRVAAVVSILVPSDEIPQSDRERVQHEVRMAADQISSFLGYWSQAS